MTKYLYNVGLRHKETGERINLRIWAENMDSASIPLYGVLFGKDCEYIWTDTNPVYKNNQIVTKKQSDRRAMSWVKSVCS